MSRLAVPRFDVRVVGVRRAVRTSQGLGVPVRPVGGGGPRLRRRPGHRVQDAGPARDGARPARRPRTPATRSGTGRAGARRVSAACIGTFVLAESGLLDQQRATTTWWLAPLFRKRYPAVLLDESSMIVKSGRFVTAGAALSHIDLALWLVRRVSPQLAALTAKYLIVDSRPSQSAYSLTDHLLHSDPIVQRFERWARDAADAGLLARRRGPRRRGQQADARAAHAGCARQVAAVVLPEPACRARGAPAEDDAARAWTRSPRGWATPTARRCVRSSGAGSPSGSGSSGGALRRVAPGRARDRGPAAG